MEWYLALYLVKIYWNIGILSHNCGKHETSKRIKENNSIIVFSFRYYSLLCICFMAKYTMCHQIHGKTPRNQTDY